MKLETKHELFIWYITYSTLLYHLSLNAQWYVITNIKYHVSSDIHIHIFPVHSIYFQFNVSFGTIVHILLAPSASLALVKLGL